MAEDRVQGLFELWKKRIIAAFAFLSLLIAITIALMVEIAGAKAIWHAEFGATAHAQTSTEAETRRTCSCKQIMKMSDAGKPAMKRWKNRRQR